MEMIERRRYPRAVVHEAARLLVDGRVVVGCVVLDISTDGARLDLSETSVVPDTFDLIMARGGHACRVVWRTGSTMGVQFHASGEC